MDDNYRHGAEDSYRASQGFRATAPDEGIRTRAVIVGVIVDWLATDIARIAYVMVFMRESIEKYGGFENIPDEVLLLEPPLALIGILGTTLGGYVAGRMARGRHVLHGAVVAVVSNLLSFALILAIDGRILLYGWQILLLVLIIPAGAFGGYLAYRLGKAVTAPTPGVPTTPTS